MKKLNVGIVGVNATRGWAAEAHVPAIRHLPGLRLAAVATRSAESARVAADAFGAERAYGDAAGLVADPDIDIVAVVSSVASHHDVITAAVESGKDVLTEWPVGVDLAQTEAIAAAVARSGRRLTVSLQARTDPAVLAAREAVLEGRLGRLLSASAYSTTAGFGPVVPENELYLEQPGSGMNLPTIQAAHTLDLLQHLAGTVTDMDALTTIQFPELCIEDTERTAQRTLGDHVLLHARLDSGAVAAMQVAGGRPVDATPFSLELIGTRGRLLLSGGAPRGFQAGRLSLSVDGTAVTVDDGERTGLTTSPFNVAGTYAALREDILKDTDSGVTATDAVELARLVTRFSEVGPSVHCGEELAAMEAALGLDASDGTEASAG